MKKILSIICVAAITAASALTAAAGDIKYKKGDTDMDGRISIDDATHIQRYLAEMLACDDFWSFFTADTDNNGVIDINDVSVIQRELLQYETTLNNIPDGNATIAQAAVTMSYERKGEGYMAPGNEVYRGVFALTMNGDDIMRSCDRFVCAAVRWSGADDNYPLGHVGTQADYIAAHPEKWQPVYGSTFIDSDSFRYSAPTELQPGDVIIEYSAYDYRSHTFIYCGESLIASIFPDSASEKYSTTSASYNDYAPECRNWRLGYKYFRAFRCKKYEENPKYKNVGLLG